MTKQMRMQNNSAYRFVQSKETVSDLSHRYNSLGIIHKQSQQNSRYHVAIHIYASELHFASRADDSRRCKCRNKRKQAFFRKKILRKGKEPKENDKQTTTQRHINKPRNKSTISFLLN
jgi:hypothetical protein